MRRRSSIGCSASIVVDPDLVAYLEARHVGFCVIGGIALAVHGFARYTADVDVLTMDAAVLAPEFWSGTAVIEVRRGEGDDPLAGLVRWPSEPPHDLLVGRGHAMHFAVDTAVANATIGARVATPLALVLLKLEAGGPQDRNDILALVQAQETLAGAGWLADVPQHLPLLSAEARACWAHVAPDLERR